MDWLNCAARCALPSTRLRLLFSRVTVCNPRPHSNPTPPTHRCEELSSRLEAVDRSAAAERSAALSAKLAVSRLESELRVARSGQASLEQEAAALRQQLQVTATWPQRRCAGQNTTMCKSTRVNASP